MQKTMKCCSVTISLLLCVYILNSHVSTITSSTTTQPLISSITSSTTTQPYISSITSSTTTQHRPQAPATTKKEEERNKDEIETSRGTTHPTARTSQHTKAALKIIRNNTQPIQLESQGTKNPIISSNGELLKKAVLTQPTPNPVSNLCTKEKYFIIQKPAQTRPAWTIGTSWGQSANKERLASIVQF